MLETEQDLAASSSDVESKRPRLDTGKDIFTHLTSVFDDVEFMPAVGARKEEVLNSDGDTVVSHTRTDTTEGVSVWSNHDLKICMVKCVLFLIGISVHLACLDTLVATS